MAGPFTHCILARRLIDSLQSKTGQQPIESSFFLGALAPDAGYMRAKSSIYADLAHNIATSRLAKNLLEIAKTESDYSFALGWVSHAILDRFSHPIINSQSARVLGTTSPITFEENPILHSYVEMGIDATWIKIIPDLDCRHLKREIPSISQLIEKAYSLTYGLNLPANEFQKSLTRMLIAMKWLNRFYRITRGNLSRSNLQPRSRLYAILLPMRPDPSFLDATSQCIDRTDHEFRRGIDSRFLNYPDFNLDTGNMAFFDSTYPLAVKTLERLNSMRTCNGQAPMVLSELSR